MKLISKLVIGLALVGSVFADKANAGIIMEDLGSNNYSIEMDAITFTINNTAGSHARLIVEDFYTNNSTQCGTHVSGGVNWSVNGGPVVQLATHACSGVWNGGYNEMDPNDLFVNFGTNYDGGVGNLFPHLQIGDEVTISITNMVFSTSQTRVMAQGPFEAKLVHGATLIADSVMIDGGLSQDVPEPSTMAMFALGLAGLAARRHKNI